MQVYLNGKMIDADKATVSVADAGFTHAVGLFETMQAYGGKVFRLDEHLTRMQTSAAELGLAQELDVAALKTAVEKTIKANDMAFARIRLTVTAGEISLLSQGETPKPPKPTVLVVAQPPTLYDPAYFTKGVAVLIAQPGANPFDSTAGHKTLAYWQRLRTLRQASSAGAGEAIWLNVTNHLASGAISNIFLVKDDVLLTPFARGEEVQGALPAPVLPGTMRAAILEIADALNLPVEKRMLSVSDMLEADEVFLTNSSWLVLPVTGVEKSIIAQGKVGPITEKLRGEMGKLIEKETGFSLGEPQGE